MPSESQKDFIFLATALFAIVLSTLMGFWLQDLAPWIWITATVCTAFAVIFLTYYLRQHLSRNADRYVPKIKVKKKRATSKKKSRK